MEIQNIAIGPIKAKIPLMIQDIANELLSTQLQINSNHQALQHYEHSVRLQEDAIRSLESRIQDAEMASTVSDIGVSHRCCFGPTHLAEILLLYAVYHPYTRHWQCNQ